MTYVNINTQEQLRMFMLRQKKMILNPMLDAIVASSPSRIITTAYVSTALKVDMCIPMSRPLQTVHECRGLFPRCFRNREKGGGSCLEPIRNGPVCLA